MSNVLSVAALSLLAQGARAQQEVQHIWTRGTNIYTLRGPNTDFEPWLPPADLGLVTELVATRCQVVAKLHDGSLRAWGPGGTTVPNDFGKAESLYSTWHYAEGCSNGTFFAILPTGEARTWTVGATTSQPFAPPSMGAIQRLSCTGYVPSLIAIREDGSVWDPSGPVPSEAFGCVDVTKSFSAGVTAALRADGTLVVWGIDLCYGVFGPCDRGVFRVMTVSDAAPFTQITSGNYGIAAIRADGALRLFGERWGTCHCCLFEACCEGLHPSWRGVTVRAFQPFYGDLQGTLDDGRIRLNSQFCNGSAPGTDTYRLPTGIALTALPVEPFAMLGIFSPTVDTDGDGISDHVDNCLAVPNSGQSNADGDRYGDPCDNAVVDCDQDNVEDPLAIAQGLVNDFNANQVPDSCDCLGDINRDGIVDGTDIGELLSAWGMAGTDAPADTNLDGSVDGKDLASVLSLWGPCVQ